MLLRAAFVLLVVALISPWHAVAQTEQDKPVQKAPTKPRAQAQGKPIDKAQRKPTDEAQGQPTGQAQGKAAGGRGAATPTPALKPQSPPAGRGAAAAPLANTDQLIEPPGFAYAAEGRRDPFVSLLRRGSEPRTGSPGIRPSGLGGLGTEEITLRGTVRSREGFVGILQGADQKTYIVRAGDKLFDGTIRTISQNDLVIVQQVNDPLSREKQREVRKVLRQIEAK